MRPSGLSRLNKPITYSCLLIFQCRFTYFYKIFNLSFNSFKCFILLLVLFCLLSFLEYLPSILTFFCIFWHYSHSNHFFLVSMSAFYFSNITSQHQFNHYFMIPIIIRIILWRSASLFLNSKSSFDLGTETCLPMFILVINLWVFLGYIYVRNKVFIQKFFSPLFILYKHYGKILFPVFSYFELITF